jgi:hypothetical protein
MVCAEVPIRRHGGHPSARGCGGILLNGTTFLTEGTLRRKSTDIATLPLLISVLSPAPASAAFGQPPAIPMDWASCEQEVVRLYVDGAKTIHETLEYLHEKHGITATQV